MLTIENKGNIKIVNIKRDKNYDTYIGRKNGWLNLEESKWGNPFVLKSAVERDLICEQYYNYVLGREDLIKSLHELKDKTLGCYCCTFSKDTGLIGNRCHGLELIKLYDKYVI